MMRVTSRPVACVALFFTLSGSHVHNVNMLWLFAKMVNVKGVAHTCMQHTVAFLPQESLHACPKPVYMTRCPGPGLERYMCCQLRGGVSGLDFVVMSGAVEVGEVAVRALPHSPQKPVHRCPKPCVHEPGTGNTMAESNGLHLHDPSYKS